MVAAILEAGVLAALVVVAGRRGIDV